MVDPPRGFEVSQLFRQVTMVFGMNQDLGSMCGQGPVLSPRDPIIRNVR